MPSITATRPVIEERFPVLGFTVRTGLSPSWFEVALATDPKLFRPDAASQRNGKNFYSSRAAGALAAPRGEAVYLVPADVLARFVGQPRLYYRLAVAQKSDLSDAQPVNLPEGLSPAVVISGTFSGRTRRLQIGPRQGGITGYADNYAKETPGSLTWAGDAPVPGKSEVVKSSASITPKAPSNGSAAKPVDKPTAQAADVAYSDGYDDEFWAKVQEADAAADADADDHGIEGPVPDDGGVSVARALGNGATQPEYPQASRFVPAASSNYRQSTGQRTIRRVVIHITDGGSKINGTIGWFQNPSAKVSAHYVVGQDGEVVQMVPENDVAWHANGANGDSIGIEHVANTRGLLPTEAEYCASAALVRYLCDKYGLATDHVDASGWGPGVTGIQGHSEADPKTGHRQCPNAVWDWPYFMALVQKSQCFPRADLDQVTTSQGLGGNGRTRKARPFEIVEPIAPGDSQSSAQFMKDFQDRKQSWSAGVADTSFFPHSAICQINVTGTDGTSWLGTGFYIARDYLLTAAHVADGAASLTIIPGRNGDQKPFGSFNAAGSDCTIHPSYSSDSRAFDMALIRVGTPPPNGQFFDILEELLQSLPSPIIVCGYAAKTVNQDKQHLDGDMVRTVADETLQYNLQTEPGASGSPVYYLWGREDEERQMSVLEYRVVGVHVASSSDQPKTLNRACRLTEAKIQWIRSVLNPVFTGAQAYTPKARKNGKPVPCAKAAALADPLQPGEVVKAGGKSYVIYDSEVRSGGVWAWLNNNPGNITKSKEAESYGAYAGKGNGGFAIFPDHDTGFQAIVSFLRKRSDKTIAQMMAIYAPPDDGKTPMLKGNDPVAYANAIARKLGVSADTVVKNLSDDQLTAFASEIERIETGPKGTGTVYTYDDPSLPQEVRDRLPAPPPPADSGGDTPADAGTDAAQGLAFASAATAPAKRIRVAGDGSSSAKKNGTRLATARAADAAGDVPLSLKEADYAEHLGEDPDPEQPAAEPGAGAMLTNQQMYRIIREVVQADSGDAAYAAVSADQEYETPNQPAYQRRHFGLGFGLVLFTQESGHLGSVLGLMQKRDAGQFAEVFGPNAAELLAVTNAATPEERLKPVGGEVLWGPTWVERFRRAGAVPAFQAAQNEEAIEGLFRPMLNVAAGLGFVTDRGLAMVFDRVVARGLGGGLRWVVQAAGPLRTAGQREHALEMLEFEDLIQFQTVVGWVPQNGRFGPETHAALVGALRRQGVLPLPGPDELVCHLAAAATGSAKRRLVRLRDSANFADTVFAINNEAV
jgi:V8-like Glu-specific endopeptidase/N-acetyl-anhydromuramyl-L-alanine amidase AmpD